MRRISAILLLVCCSFSWAEQSSVKGFPQFENAIDSLANDIELYIKGDPSAGGSVIINDDAFRGPGAAGRRISTALRKKLKGRLNIIRFNGYRIAGHYSSGQSQDGEFVFVITNRIMNQGNVEQVTGKYAITSDEEIAIELFGATVDATKKQHTPGANQIGQISDSDDSTLASTDERHVERQIAQAITHPELTSISVTGPQTQTDNRRSIIRFSDDSPYGVSIIKQGVDSDQFDVPCEISLERGIAHTTFSLSDVFAIRVHNESRKPVGVTVLVDGLNTFEFCEIPRFKKSGKYSCGPLTQSDIRGWYINTESLRKFELVNRESGAASLASRTSGIGVITVVFHEDLTKTPEQTSRKPVKGLAVGVGGTIGHSGRTKTTKFGKLLGSVSVRYLREGLPNDQSL